MATLSVARSLEASATIGTHPGPTLRTSDILHASAALRVVGDRAESLEEVALALTHSLRDHLVDPQTGQSLLPLVCCYLTQRRGEVRAVRHDALQGPELDAGADPDDVCLTLLASSTDDPSWEEGRSSVSGWSIPFPSSQAQRGGLMVAELFRQLSPGDGRIAEGNPPGAGLPSENVFFVAEVGDSPYLLAQDGFVIPEGIHSVVGVGGTLPGGAVLALLLYSSVPIPAATLPAFAAVALSVRIAALGHVGGVVYAGQTAVARSVKAQAALEVSRSDSRTALLSQLLDLRTAISEREATQAEEEARELARSVALDVTQAENQARALARSVARDVAISEDQARELARSVALEVAGAVAREVASTIDREVANTAARDLASSVARDVASSEDDARHLASEVARDVASSANQARELASSVARDVASSEDMARQLASSVARDLASSEDEARHLASEVARDVASSENTARKLASEVARDVASSVDVARQLAKSVARDVASYEDQARELAISRTALAMSEARKTAVLEGALDCVIGMDSQGRITDANRAAELTFGWERSRVIGEDLAETLIPAPMRARHRQGLAKMLATGEGPILGRRVEVNAMRLDGTVFPAELSVTRVEGTPPSFNAYVRDITSRHQAEAELAFGRRRLEHIARTLQTSLLPPILPEIHGIELAAAFRALGDGYEVGGDFYDVFELGDDQWALTLGDVCGKGSEAAVVTALARYTLRAAAMRRRDPAEVLATLNEAIFRQHPDRFCTAVYATLDPNSGRVKLALGGHPHPFLLTAAGSLRVVGVTSPILGPFEEWHGSTGTVDLAPGDTLLFYSDGVSEARSGADFFGDDRLAALLAEAVGLDAAATVKLIEDTVLRFAGELSDDLALLAIRRADAP